MRCGSRCGPDRVEHSLHRARFSWETQQQGGAVHGGCSEWRAQVQQQAARPACMTNDGQILEIQIKIANDHLVPTTPTLLNVDNCSNVLPPDDQNRRDVDALLWMACFVAECSQKRSSGIRVVFIMYLERCWRYYAEGPPAEDPSASARQKAACALRLFDGSPDRASSASAAARHRMRARSPATETSVWSRRASSVISSTRLRIAIGPGRHLNSDIAMSNLQFAGVLMALF